MSSGYEEYLIFGGGYEYDNGGGVCFCGSGEEFAFGEAGECAGEAPGGSGPGGGVLDGVLPVVAVEDGEVHVGVKVVVWWEPDGYISWGEEEGVPG